MAASLTLLIRRKRIKLFWVRKKQKYGIKVKKSTVSILFKPWLHNIQIIKVMKMVRHQAKKISNQ